MTDHDATWQNRLLTALCQECLEWGATPGDVNMIHRDLPQVFMDMRAEAEERDWLDTHDPETIARRDASYAERVQAAGRGHLLK